MGEQAPASESVKLQTGSAAPLLALPRIREDLKLYPGPAHRDGSPSWRILDPVRNAFFEIGWLEFELLARWANHRDAQTLIEQVRAETPIAPTLGEVGDLIEFLAANQLLVPSAGLSREALQNRWRSSKRPWYERVLHQYLFFRVPLFRPDAFLARTVGWTDAFFTRGFLLVVIVALGIDLFLLSREWHSFSDSFARLLTPQGIFFYAVAATFAKVIHELAHAYAARRYGVRVPTMGLAFMILWPYLYTDTGETWKLSDRRKQLVVAAAGVVAELTLAVFATLLWALAPDGAVKSVLFVLATSTWLMTLAINVSPFMRFDGYFILSDALDFPNLHERSFACARWWLRTTFFRLDEPLCEPTLPARNRRWLIAFAFVTWLYRLTVFLAIALLMYFLFFKLLGIVLMAVELVWFIFRPVWTEAAYLWRKRGAISLAWKPTLVAAALIALGVWLVPVASEVSAPGIYRAANEQAVYAPFPARVVSVAVSPGQQVVEGGLLVSLEAQGMKVRAVKAEVAITSARAELARTPASVRQQERRSVLEQQLAEALASRQAVVEEAANEQLHATHAGTVREVHPDIIPGRWVSPRQLLFRVVSESEPLIEAYVGEQQVEAVRPGQRVRFYADLPHFPVVRATVISVDKTPLREISRPLLASVHGGEIVVTHDAKGPLLAREAVFRVNAKPDGAAPKAVTMVRGTLRIETDIRLVAENFVSRTLSLLIRESGF